jgi:FMN-dependent oxidoreductase (nitrilotriacetate monooxygenase family)
VSKRIHVNVFEMNCVGHVSHGLWVHPENNRHRFNDVEFWIELAKLAEHGCFDAMFLADVIGTSDQFRSGPQTALREAVMIPNNDPLLLIPAMAAATKHLGFAATFSTSYEPPFPFARRMSTLDHLTKGRIAWNVVTSFQPNAARNFGLDDEIEHDLRYKIADEFIDVLYKLWEGSWDDDAVVQDRENRMYTDPAKVRYINHVGPMFRVAGPHLSQPSPQRSPVIYQAGASDAGRDFAARHAEAVFVGGSSLAGARALIADVRARAKRNGRDPDHIKFFVGVSVIVAPTQEQAEAKYAEFKRLRSVEGHLAFGGADGFDWTRYPPHTRIGDVARDDPMFAPLIGRYKPESTVGAVLDRVGGYHTGPLLIVGSPKVAADQLEKVVDGSGADGVNLRQYLTPGTIEDFIDLVVPELRRRGRYREAYVDGETLRERLFGPGNSRLFDTHPGARYRDPAALSGRV